MPRKELFFNLFDILSVRAMSLVKKIELLAWTLAFGSKIRLFHPPAPFKGGQAKYQKIASIIRNTQNYTT